VVPREALFIDMRIDSWSMGNVMNTEVRWSPTSPTAWTI